MRITKINFCVAPVAAAKSRGQSGFWHRANIDTGRQGLHRNCDVSALWHLATGRPSSAFTRKVGASAESIAAKGVDVRRAVCLGNRAAID
ncbi:hypothetical protein [Paraburkholderia hospita]|uniref:hypothetical protein n=1 Tax=Paraburkholderia hospita TaxID=169430 RepID=UPI0010566E51|nr:hypothetical protein [Paraburkholderia hospita]